MILVTGGAGFIGSNFILEWLRTNPDTGVVNVDKLTYAGNLENLASLRGDARHRFVQADIGDSQTMAGIFREHRPRAIVNFAAETHVDRSIRGPENFIRTNITATAHLLEEVRAYWGELPAAVRDAFRFVQVSTDEVYGSLGADDPPFAETTAYAPNSPYAASKAAADHLVRAYHHTYGLPTLTTNCSNNYGPLQFPEKLIPLMILNGVAGKPLPVYGDGRNVRDWLEVRDHCEALRVVLATGRPGQTYNIGGNSERTNLEVVSAICRLLDEFVPLADGRSRRSLISFVADRPGHDRRYAIDARKIQTELGWRPRESFAGGLRKTVRWYLENEAWVRGVQTGEYRRWIQANYEGRG